ncbi:uncharacterized protein LOC113388301 [Ctenocephalides felis]|uniref:uncharacterized protein LOC113388301 n=1 Tax=Ctenocephalides felis TaxID=7515 RepID=UPI000E6E3E8F|nr:uncharacterized protein LOC113388301 [Ctenocephalides felis]
MWARQCIPCQKSKIHKQNHLTPIHIPIPENRFLHIHIDIIKLPNINGYPYCLTIIDRFTRWPEAIPLKDISADTIVQALFSNWISRFGTPCVITSDQGCQFESAIFKSLMDAIGAKKIRTTAYHPQSNGLVERWHRTSYKEDLKASPAEMVYGTTLRLPDEFFTSKELSSDPQAFLDCHRKIMRAIKPTATAHHNKANMFVLKDMNTCTHVFVRADNIRKPLEPPYSGPYKIIERISYKVYNIFMDGTNKSISVDRLKPAYTVKTDNSQPSTLQEFKPHLLELTMVSPRKTNSKKVSFKL